MWKVFPIFVQRGLHSGSQSLWVLFVVVCVCVFFGICAFHCGKSTLHTKHCVEQFFRIENCAFTSFEFAHLFSSLIYDHRIWAFHMQCEKGNETNIRQFTYIANQERKHKYKHKHENQKRKKKKKITVFNVSIFYFSLFIYDDFSMILWFSSFLVYLLHHFIYLSYNSIIYLLSHSPHVIAIN